ncbi:MAG: D-xylose transporter XylE [Candidatus Azobacteroides sp.]|nr:D-xylose transporter XylE [Candidatus Azobacteroides sp.]
MGGKKEYNVAYITGITLVATLGGLLFGYDTAVISGAEKGLEAFFLQATDFQYNKVLHGITSSSALIGCVIGGALSGFFATRFGRRDSLRFASVLFFLSALGSSYPEFLFFQKGIPTLDLLVTFNLYRVLGGIGVGLASAVIPMYIAEIAPSQIRGTLVSCNQFAIIFGMLVVYFVNYMILGDHTNPVIDKDPVTGMMFVDPASDPWTIATGWRRMFLSEAFPAALFGIMLFLVPKTPRYLVMVDQEDKALAVLTKVNGVSKAKEILSEIKATSKEKTEKLFAYGVAVVIIGIMLSVFQQAIGINAVLYYAPRIFESAGAEGGGMMQTVIMGIVNIVFTVVAIFTVDKLGRKPLLIVVSIGMAVGAFSVAICDHLGLKGIVPVLSIIVYAAFFMMSWGPVCWVLISEIFPNTIRGKAIAIAVAFQWIFNYIVSSTFPPLYDFSPMVAYGLYGTICILAALFVWKWVPETKGKTLEDMSRLWRKKEEDTESNTEEN